jgi:hypothetical protein
VITPDAGTVYDGDPGASPVWAMDESAAKLPKPAPVVPVVPITTAPSARAAGVGAAR